MALLRGKREYVESIFSTGLQACGGLQAKSGDRPGKNM
jgi:hypothetical protein